MQTKLGNGFDTKVLAWKEDTKEKEMSICFLKEIIRKQSCSLDGEINITHDVLQDYSYYDKNIYQNVLNLLQKGDGIDSGEKNFVVYRKDIAQAITDTRKAIEHFK